MEVKNKKVLVTGAAGYIGSVLTRQLLDQGYTVRGFDRLLFGGEALIGIFNHPHFEFVNGDIRNTEQLAKALEDVDYVVHLAAIVGDPACAKQPELAKQTNWEASKVLFELSQEKKVQRFVFASTCSNYGKMAGDDYVTEDSPLRPVSLYAELKVKFEQFILNSKTREDFVPTALRFATVYGISPRMRFDLTVNEFVRDLFFGKELEVFGEQFWRPYCHVEDLARSCVVVLESDKNKVDHNVFNVGNTNENYTKKMIVEEILKVLPEAKIKYVHKEEDPRDYRVSFEKIKRTLGYTTTKTVPQGIQELVSLLQSKLLTDPFSDRYKNI